MLYQLLILLFIIIFVISFIAIFTKISNNNIIEYEVLLPYKGNGKGMNYCLSGCNRGVCKNTNNKDNCKYDFQCQYCQDKVTNMFYVDSNNQKEILPLYEEEEKLNNSEKDVLNELILKNNKYIHELNNKIRLLNSSTI
jgi:hypothetical protein